LTCFDGKRITKNVCDVDMFMLAGQRIAQIS
jgi:hypothetical protein